MGPKNLNYFTEHIKKWFGEKKPKFNIGDEVYMDFCESSGKVIEVGYDGDPDAYVVLINEQGDQYTEVAQATELKME